MSKASRLRRQRDDASSPDPVVNMPGVDAKLRRAECHLQAIKAQVLEFAAPNPEHFVTDYDQARKQMVTRPHPSLFASREDWATVIGDCVHNLRSALDHLAHELVVLGGGTPKSGRNGTAFPIYDSRLGPNGGPRIVQITTVQGNVAADVLAFIEGLQPYERTDEPLGHPLWVLSELDNMDKHRTLALTGVALNGFGLAINTLRDIDLHFENVGFSGPFDENTELATWKATVRGANPEMHVQPRGAIEVALAPPCIQAGEPLISTLEGLRDYVAEVVAILKFIGGKTAA
jgi:hypothetical protein